MPSHQQSSRPLLQDHDDASTLGSASDIDSSDIRTSQRKKPNIVRYVSFATAILNCLCAGSLTAYSLYGHIFQERLHYTQYQVNGCIVAGQLSMYLTVPLFGYLCDRVGPAPISALSAVTFGVGYLLAAFTYRSGALPLGQIPQGHERGWPYPVMVFAFLIIGLGTLCMYLSAVTTCAKNFGRGKYKGLALACPIAAFGLSGMWQSQLASRVMYERKPDGSTDVDVFKFFIFLAVALFIAGLLGTVGLKIVDEEELIDDALDELEQSGLLESTSFYRNARGYGGTDDTSENMLASTASLDSLTKQRIAEEARKKTWLLNEETRRFLKDRTMWWFAAGFFLVSGPGDTFINNLGTVIGTLYPPSTNVSITPTTPATHVSIVAATSTIARIFAGTVTDMLAPVAPTHHFRTSAANSVSSLPERRFTVSRVAFLLGFTVMMSIGQLVLASGLVQDHGERFWIVSSLIGSGYGAVFSLTPIIITVIWGVENFGTNWGILATSPAIGALIWGSVYSGIYQWAAGDPSYKNQDGNDAVDDVLCYGKACYSSTFWAMTVCSWIACGMWLWAWKGRDGWSKRGIAV